MLYLCSSRMFPLLHWSTLLAEPCCKFKHTKSNTHHFVIPLSTLHIYILGHCVCVTLMMANHYSFLLLTHVPDSTLVPWPLVLSSLLSCSWRGPFWPISRRSWKEGRERWLSASFVACSAASGAWRRYSNTSTGRPTLRWATHIPSSRLMYTYIPWSRERVVVNYDFFWFFITDCHIWVWLLHCCM